ncbi:protein FAM227B isoform X2 [Talpa occidentalis]|uniref:protein FAM227B isoform X2 n=1 Tax=Talpa occidentalis TaxID=50954 RepID=UPI0023F859D4|nr:protein FAM227B isoform X2 [Talpa occidentalis]
MADPFVSECPHMTYSQKMQRPPKNIEEFLKFQNLDYWPRKITLRDIDECSHTMKKIKEDSSFASIYTHLWGNVPRKYEAFAIMETRLDECSFHLKKHASKILEWSNIMYRTSSYEKLQRYRARLAKYHKKKKIMLSDEMMTKKNIEGSSFSGFKSNELTRLPRHLDAERIYLFILKTHNFDEKVFKIWKTHFLSPASIALLHDSFWWWFLHKFKPDRQNQDFLFDRISESYVILFMSIPVSRKDAFFQVYPDCLAQAIYATFQEAFPESSNLFNDEFKEDLGNNISLWLTGLRPQKGFWTHWKLNELSTTTIHGSKKVPSKSLLDSILQSQERITTSINFNVMKILKNPRAYAMSASREDSGLPKLTAKSHYCGIGPEFNHALFSFGGLSPLILYYLTIHEVPGVSKIPRQTKIKFTGIYKEPPPAPTYRDVIKEAKRQFAKNRKDFRMEKHRINEEIRYLKLRQEGIDKELYRLQAKATKKPYEAKLDFDKFLYKLRCKDRIEQDFLTPLSSSSSSESSSSIEDYKLEEDECQEKAEMNRI